MPRKRSRSSLSSSLAAFFGLSETPQAEQRGRRGRPRRHLRMERLENRSLLSADTQALIHGTVFNDLTNNGLTADDTRLSTVLIGLYRDGGNGTFQGGAPGSDDTLVGTQSTDSQGNYSFNNLTAGTYWVLENVQQTYVQGNNPNPRKVVISATDAQGVAGTTIDSFGGTSQSADVSSITTTTDASALATSAALGGQRDLFVHLTSSTGAVGLSVNTYGQELLEFTSSATGAGQRVVTWDGIHAGTTLNPTGLNHTDLTGGGAFTGIQLAIGADHPDGLATLRVYKDANNWSQATLPIPDTGGAFSERIILPFSSFVVGGGTGADFADVGAIQLELEGDSAVDGQVDMVNAIGPTPFAANFANLQLASFGDTVWVDKNSNGIQDAGEPGLPNVTVQLLQNGAVVGTTMTDPSGLYHFTQLIPGDYSLKFIAPAGSVFTAQDQGGNPSADSDPNPATGLTATFSLNSGQNDVTRDAGVLPIDLSLTKTASNSAPPIDTNVTFTITLSNAANLSAATGVAVTDLLPAGLTFVSASAAQGSYDSETGVWTVGTLASGGSTTLSIVAAVTTPGVKVNNAEVTAADELDRDSTPNNHAPAEDDQASATVTPPASLGDFVWVDKNANGIQDAGEPGLANVTVQLVQNGAVVGTTTTDAGGLYQFTQITPGDYSVKFIAPTGSAFAPQDQGGNPAADSDANPTTGATATFTLTSGQNDTTRDAGVLPIDLSLVKTVNDASPDVGSNITFTITLSNAAGLSTATGVTVADVLPVGLSFVSTAASQGSYNSAIGVWTVGTLNSGSSVTLTVVVAVSAAGVTTNTAEVSGADQLDRDSTPNNHVPGEDDQSSVVITPSAAVGDFVWVDQNGNGLQDSGEPALANVTVQLVQNGAVIDATTTNASGQYQFSHVAAGDYSLKFIAPSGSAFAPQDQGGNPAIDSDVDPATGATATFTLTPGQTDLTRDAGVLPIDLSVTKAVDNPTPLVGTDVLFTIIVSNAPGLSAASGVSLVDALPTGLTFSSAVSSLGSYNNATGVWSIGTLASGSSATLFITATVTAPFPVTNTAELTAANQPDRDSTPGNHNPSEDDQSSVALTPIAPPVGDPLTPPPVSAPPPKLSKAFFLGR